MLLLLILKIGKYKGFCLYRRSYLLPGMVLRITGHHDPSHQEDVASVQAVTTQAPCHVLVGDTCSVFSLEHHHAGEGDSFHSLDHLHSGARVGIVRYTRRLAAQTDYNLR